MTMEMTNMTNMTIKKNVCLFCGSRDGRRTQYREAASKLGAALALSSMSLIYGGAQVGLMGAAAEACLANGGKVIGIIPDSLNNHEVAHSGLTELHIVSSMHERKALMETMSDIIVALPGGFGTLDELNEIITWRLLEFHRKPIFILNIEGYFDLFLEFVKRAAEEGFINSADLNYLRVCLSIDELIETINQQ